MNKFKKYILSIFVSVIFLCLAIASSESKKTKIPYTVTEKQTVTLTYLIENNKLYYERSPGSTFFDELPSMKVYCTVTNTSEYGGIYKLYATLTSQGNTVDFADEKFIGAGATIELSETKKINHYSFQSNILVDKWGIVAPEKEIDVQVTKYKYE